MIDKSALKSFIEKEIEGTGYFLVDLKISDGNDIEVEIDSTGNADIDFCVALTRSIEEAFDRDVEDYSLSVGSAGLTSNFKVPAQYIKHIGDDVELLEKGGKKKKGVLREADADHFTVEVIEKVREEGEKRPMARPVEIRYGYDDVNWVRYDLKF